MAICGVGLSISPACGYVCVWTSGCFQSNSLVCVCGPEDLFICSLHMDMCAVTGWDGTESAGWQEDCFHSKSLIKNLAVPQRLGEGETRKCVSESVLVVSHEENVMWYLVFELCLRVLWSLLLCDLSFMWNFQPRYLHVSIYDPNKSEFDMLLQRML